MGHHYRTCSCVCKLSQYFWQCEHLWRTEVRSVFGFVFSNWVVALLWLCLGWRSLCVTEKLWFSDHHPSALGALLPSSDAFVGRKTETIDLYIWEFMFVSLLITLTTSDYKCELSKSWLNSIRYTFGVFWDNFPNTWANYNITGSFSISFISEGHLFHVCGRCPLSHTENNELRSKASGFKYLDFLMIHVWKDTRHQRKDTQFNLTYNCVYWYFK